MTENDKAAGVTSSARPGNGFGTVNIVSENNCSRKVSAAEGSR
jgi:hypothetical protein